MRSSAAGEPRGPALPSGRRAVARSILSDANAARPSALFKQAHRGLRRKIAETTHLIDSTNLRLLA